MVGSTSSASANKIIIYIVSPILDEDADLDGCVVTASSHLFAVNCSQSEDRTLDEAFID